MSFEKQKWSNHTPPSLHNVEIVSNLQGFHPLAQNPSCAFHSLSLSSCHQFLVEGSYLQNLAHFQVLTSGSYF